MLATVLRTKDEAVVDAVNQPDVRWSGSSFAQMVLLPVLQGLEQAERIESVLPRAASRSRIRL